MVGSASLFQLELLELVLKGHQRGFITQGLLGELAVAAHYLLGAVEGLEVGLLKSFALSKAIVCWLM